eukprot:scaffold15236_cov75-Cyclotella_meneghiniana.AAC.15
MVCSIAVWGVYVREAWSEAAASVEPSTFNGSNHDVEDNRDDLKFTETTGVQWKSQEPGGAS